MALETLENREFGEFISIDHEQNAITFKIQKGPIKEVGKNGCQVDDLIYIGKEIIVGLNRNFPCKENDKAIGSLSNALNQLRERTKRREAQGTEGTSAEEKV